MATENTKTNVSDPDGELQIDRKAHAGRTTAILELCLTVVVHDFVALVVGETKRVEEPGRRNDANGVVILPCRHGRSTIAGL